MNKVQYTLTGILSDDGNILFTGSLIDHQTLGTSWVVDTPVEELIDLRIGLESGQLIINYVESEVTAKMAEETLQD